MNQRAWHIVTEDNATVQFAAEEFIRLMKKLDPFVDGYYFMLPFNRVSLMERILCE